MIWSFSDELVGAWTPRKNDGVGAFDELKLYLHGQGTDDVAGEPCIDCKSFLSTRLLGIRKWAFSELARLQKIMALVFSTEPPASSP